MKPVVGKKPLRRILVWAQRALFLCGVLLLGYCGYALLDAWKFQRRESRDLDRMLRDRQRTASAPAVAAAADDGLIGRIEIPRLLLSVIVVEGVDKATLLRAVGHIPGTALPGRSGNVGLAGHRDTFFRSLKDVKIKDEVQISTLQGNFKYEVESLRVVEPENVGVLAASGKNVLTLVTCYPFYYFGPAPQRWIVRARQVVR
jgi:sortase A